MGDTIDYGVKSYEVNKNIVNCTEVQPKGLRILTTHRIYFRIANMNGTQIIEL